MDSEGARELGTPTWGRCRQEQGTARLGEMQQIQASSGSSSNAKVCTRLVEPFARPVLILCVYDEWIKGIASIQVTSKVAGNAHYVPAP